MRSFETRYVIDFKVLKVRRPRIVQLSAHIFRIVVYAARTGPDEAPVESLS